MPDKEQYCGDCTHSLKEYAGNYKPVACRLCYEINGKKSGYKEKKTRKENT